MSDHVANKDRAEVMRIRGWQNNEGRAAYACLDGLEVWIASKSFGKPNDSRNNG